MFQRNQNSELKWKSPIGDKIGEFELRIGVFSIGYWGFPES